MSEEITAGRRLPRAIHLARGICRNSEGPSEGKDRASLGSNVFPLVLRLTHE